MTLRDGHPVAVLGFGNQGTSQALNLRDAGAHVIVGARAGGPSAARAAALGFDVAELPAALAQAAYAAVLLPDEVLPALWPTLEAAVPHDATLVFAHGFNLLYSALDMPQAADVVLVSPTAPGRVLRETVERGERLPAYIAVHHDASGEAETRARSYAAAIGCGPLWPTTVREETEVDLFGEQVVLCGGLQALVRTAFDVLVRRGHAPEIAYLECVHQLRYLAELLHARGPAGFREGISGTARYGDITRGPRVIGPESRAAMEQILDEIQSGDFASEWKAEVAAGGPRLAAAARAAAEDSIEQARRRALGEPGAGPAGAETAQR